MSLKKILRLFVVFLFILNIYGQKENSLQIVLTDQESAIISEAIIKLKTGEGLLVKEILAKNTQDFIFQSLKEGNYILEVQAVGFKSLTKNFNLNFGKNVLNLQLQIEELKVDVKIEPNQRLEDAFSRSWTKDEIKALPNNPNDISRELKRRYGNNLVIRVNGFKGGKIPPKEQIASIKVILSSFDAEFHEVGYTFVDIQSKASLPKISGYISFVFNDARLNARNAFATEKLPQQLKTFSGYLGIPLIKNKTSATISIFANDNYQKNNIIAIVPNKVIENTVQSIDRIVFADFGLDHNLSKNHTIHLNYSLESGKGKNLGVGGFNLPETGFSENSKSHHFRVSETGLIKEKFVNEFRLSFSFGKSKSTSNTQTPSLEVLDAFTSGGAGIDNNNKFQKIDVVNNFFFDQDNHSLKFGGEIEFENLNSFSADNTFGKYIFLSLDNFQDKTPETFTQRQGTSQLKIKQTQIAFYAQDDIRLHSKLQIGLGLRYELQNNLRDLNNFSPRLSLIFSPSKEGKVVFRTGAGIFYHWFDSGDLATILNDDGRQSNDLIITHPSYPNPLISGTISQSLEPSIKTKATNLINPLAFIIKTGLNYRVTEGLNLDVFHTFERGIHQFRSRDLNAPINGIRPNSNYGIISHLESSGNLKRNSLEINVEGRLFKFIGFDGHYTLSKSTNDFEGMFQLPMDNYNLHLEKGNSDFDQRHSLNGSLNFSLFKNLQVSPIFRIESPTSYTITTGFDDNNDTNFNDRPPGIRRNTERGNWLTQVDLRLGWQIPLIRKKITTSVNNGLKSDDNDSNEDSAQNYSIGMQITIENLFNQTNKQGFVGNQHSPFFRQATSAEPARTIQFGLSWGF